MSLLLIFIVALGAVSAEEGLGDYSSDFGADSNNLMSDDDFDLDDEDDFDYEDDDFDLDDEDDFDYEDDDESDYGEDDDWLGDDYWVDFDYDEDGLDNNEDEDLDEVSEGDTISPLRPIDKPNVFVVGDQKYILTIAPSPYTASNETNDSEEDAPAELSDDMDNNTVEEPIATLGSESSDDNISLDSSSEDNSSKGVINLNDNHVTGHPVLMLILSLFALFIAPISKE